MTRFGKWFAGAVIVVVGLFVVGLLMPGRQRPAAETGGMAARPSPVDPVAAPSPVAGATRAWSGLAIPVAGVAAADLIDTFGDPRGLEGERGHGALDIMAPRGAPVVAAADGVVEKLFESDLGGHTVYVRSPNRRNVYYYAHLDSYAPGLREGVVVHAGERIGAVGSSGDADPAGPHLHFEVRRVAPGDGVHGGRPINPYPLLAGAAAGG